jgi:hypothetical protein
MTMRVFDRSPPGRVYVDKDGRLHVVGMVPLTIAGIVGYRGCEVPNWRRLGLDEGAVYRVLRPPAELKRSAALFGRLPILSRHVPLMARDYRDVLVGATGSRTTWANPFVLGDLVLWTRDSIDALETGERRELSPGFNYDADPASGVFEGQPFDLTATNIRPHHLSLSKRSRVSGMAMDAARFARREAA